mmetsp:Transcript_63900/g.103310  ORF Transcript_63900/g.103310 Transcript_63900/m.103310 type:complete len:100 (+) Transcript_63900:608-907(+)
MKAPLRFAALLFQGNSHLIVRAQDPPETGKILCIVHIPCTIINTKNPHTAYTVGNAMCGDDFMYVERHTKAKMINIEMNVHHSYTTMGSLRVRMRTMSV